MGTRRIIGTFEIDYELTHDDMEMSFGSFSVYELKMLTVQKNDFVSKFIRGAFLDIEEEKAN